MHDVAVSSTYDHIALLGKGGLYCTVDFGTRTGGHPDFRFILLLTCRRKAGKNVDGIPLSICPPKGEVTKAKLQGGT